MRSVLEIGPDKARPAWYVAELIIRIAVEGDDRTVVQKNLMLINSDTPEEAYQKAITAGEEHTMSYLNPEGRRVDIQFVGLGKLNAVYDRLEDGAELSYEEYLNVPDDQVSKWVVPKHLLSIFRQREPSSGPDYSSADVLDEASRLMGQ